MDGDSFCQFYSSLAELFECLENLLRINKTQKSTANHEDFGSADSDAADAGLDVENTKSLSQERSVVIMSALLMTRILLKGLTQLRKWSAIWKKTL
jgi:hypothetical protein